VTSVWSHFAYNLISPRCVWDVTEWMLVIGKKFQSECNNSLCWGVYSKAWKITVSCIFSFQECVAVCFDTGRNLSEGRKWWLHLQCKNWLRPFSDVVPCGNKLRLSSGIRLLSWNMKLSCWEIMLSTYWLPGVTTQMAVNRVVKIFPTFRETNI